MKKIIIGADAAGLVLKDSIVVHLNSMGYEVNDVGMTSGGVFKAYYEVAPLVAEAISTGTYEKGILICGTGIGMSIVANKYKDIYAAVVESSLTGKLSAIINNANVLAMGGNIIGPKTAIDTVDRWMNTGFTEGFEHKADFLHNALTEVKAIENKNFK